MTRAAILAAAIALAVPAPATARPSAATVRLDAAITLARAYWHDRSCQPNGWITDVDWTRYGGMSIGRPDLGICTWGIDPRWPRWRWAVLCPIVVHEFGHLAGLGHSPDPASIMNGDRLIEHPEICGTRPRSTPLTTSP